MFVDPEVNEAISIGGQVFAFSFAAGYPDVVYAEIGRKAKVYRLLRGKQPYALKVFKPRYRTASAVENSHLIAQYKDVPGLTVANRTILYPDQFSDLIGQHPEYAYSVLMPWVEGDSWFNYVVKQTPTSNIQSLRLAKALVNVLVELEERGLAHCDLSGGNFIFSSDFCHVELIDIEEMFGQGLKSPDPLPAGTGGYAPNWVKETGIWEAGADRFSGGILLCEILGWQSEDIRTRSAGDNYFADGEFGNRSKRYGLMKKQLEEIHRDWRNCLRRYGMRKEWRTVRG